MRYRDRHTRMEIVPCVVLFILFMAVGSMIVFTGLNSRFSHSDTNYILRINLYSDGYDDVFGNITIFQGTGLYEDISISSSDITTTKSYLGNYTLYYKGRDNGVEFGPLEFVVSTSGLVLDTSILDIRITVIAM